MEALALPPQSPLDFDQRITLSGMRWTDYEVMLALRGDRPGPRITYLRGTLELMSPSFNHEAIKKMMARLLEAWALQNDVPLIAAGSWTLRSAPDERGIEPDECYMLGRQKKERPDLALEVIWTAGGLDKLEVYRGLGVSEVWLWRDGAIEAHVLEGDRYVRAVRSRLLPALDLDRLARLAVESDQHAALQAFLRQTRQRG